VNSKPARDTDVPLLDLKGQYATIKSDIDAAIARVVDAQWFILGPEVAALEEEVAAFTGTAFGVGMSSGTDALLAALMALDVGPGDEVIVPTYTFFATAGVVARLGARPVFVDIDPGTYNIDPAGIAASITENTKAVIPVHLYGRMADMDAILAAAGGIPVIEDAAQAIGAFDEHGRRAGSIGVMGCLSFFPSKNLGGFGDGGMTLTGDAATAGRLKALRMHGMEPKYYHAMVGGNFRLDALQAAVLRVKLRHLADWSEARRKHAALYRTLLEEGGVADRIGLPADVPGHIYNQFVIRARERDRLQEHLRQAGIGTEVYYPLPLHLQECFSRFGPGKGSMPHAEAAARQTLALPVYPELREEQIAFVVDRIIDFCGRSENGRR
jgi:dTDP-4-amino-4,6-dideoxygalactose transaminase